MKSKQILTLIITLIVILTGYQIYNVNNISNTIKKQFVAKNEQVISSDVFDKLYEKNLTLYKSITSSSKIKDNKDEVKQKIYEQKLYTNDRQGLNDLNKTIAKEIVNSQSMKNGVIMQTLKAIMLISLLVMTIRTVIFLKKDNAWLYYSLIIILILSTCFTLEAINKKDNTITNNIVQQQ